MTDTPAGLPDDELTIFTETEEESMAVAAARRRSITLTRPVTAADQEWIAALPETGDRP